jgi:hypothetical protein
MFACLYPDEIISSLSPPFSRCIFPFSFVRPLRTPESFRDLASPFPTINLVPGSKYQAARQVLVLFHLQ